MRAIKILQQYLRKSLFSVHKKRLQTLFWAVRVLMLGGRLSLTGIGRAARGKVSPKHNIKRVDRLLGNRHLHNETDIIFSSICDILIHNKQRPIVIIDWTAIGQSHSALAAKVPLDGRAIPIYIEVHKMEKEGNAGVHKEFLKKLKKLLPQYCRPIIVTDAGFRNPWFKEILSCEWDFVGRILSNAHVNKEGTNNWHPMMQLYEKATAKAKDLGKWLVSERTPAMLRLVLFKQKSKGRKTNFVGLNAQSKARNRAKEPWLLATSLDDVTAKKVVSIYALRMQIEETFRDTKNRRFGWCFRDARSQSSSRLRVLLLIATLGLIAVTLLGLAAESNGLYKSYQANTVRSHRVLSLFVLGNNLIRRGDDKRVLLLDLKIAFDDFLRKIVSLNTESEVIL